MAKRKVCHGPKRCGSWPRTSVGVITPLSCAQLASVLTSTHIPVDVNTHGWPHGETNWPHKEKRLAVRGNGTGRTRKWDWPHGVSMLASRQNAARLARLDAKFVSVSVAGGSPK